MSTAYLGLGTNIGRREHHLAHALRELARAPDVEIAAVSTVYETEPVGYAEQPRFLNMVVRLETELTPREILDLALRIEAERGRERSFLNAPRTLDIDLLLYDERRVREPDLTVPHPRMTDRPFVLVPLLELAPDLADPVTGRPFREFPAARPSGMRPFCAGEVILEIASP